MVERALALSGIGMESVTWKATRRGLEPWKITATFEAAGRTARAEWSWNMHDNAVACLNSTAKKLLGTATARAATDRGHALRDAACDAARGFGTLGEDRAHRVGVEHPCPDTACGSPRSADATFGVPVGRAHRACAIRGRPSIDIPRTGALPAKAGEAALGAAESKPPRPTPDSGTSASAAQTAPEIESESGKTSAERSDRQTPPAKRRSGRSAVPSWDEILFGE